MSRLVQLEFGNDELTLFNKYLYLQGLKNLSNFSSFFTFQKNLENSITELEKFPRSETFWELWREKVRIVTLVYYFLDVLLKIIIRIMAFFTVTLNILANKLRLLTVNDIFL